MSSVAGATGLNRETTRRKISQLVDIGLLSRTADGHVHLHPNLPIREEMVRTVRAQLEPVAKVADEFLRDDILKLGRDEKQG